MKSFLKKTSVVFLSLVLVILPVLGGFAPGINNEVEAATEYITYNGEDVYTKYKLDKNKQNHI